MTPEYRGDATLDRLLKEAGVALGVAEVRDLVQGVAVAPAGVEPDAWMALVGPNIDGKLSEQLRALLAEISAPRVDQDRSDRTARLKALRTQLRRRRLAGFVIPRGDEHQGEWVPACAERLAWLTGFTGSAGTAVVLTDHAALFVDGRYTVQAHAEVNASLYEIRHVTDEPLADWIAERLPAGGRLGYDPWLHTPSQGAVLRSACERAGGRLTPVVGNPVDAVWADRPPPPIALIVRHPEAFAGAPSAEKRRRVAETLARAKHDAAVVSAPDSIAWMLNIRGGDVPYAPLALAFAVLHANAFVDLFLEPRKLTAEARLSFGNEVTVMPLEAFGPALDRLGAANRIVRVDPDGTPEWAAERLRTAGAQVVSGPDPCLLPKAVKTPVELDGIRAAHQRDGAALTRFLAWLAGEAAGGDVTEIAAADRLEAFRRENKRFRGLSFPTISGASANGAVVHYRVTAATNRRLEPGALYLVDSGAQYLDGTTDVTRTVAVGRPTDEMRDRFTRVLKGHIALATARFPKGTTGPQLDALARRALWDAGLDYDHGTGHGVGHYLSVHEGPQRISKIPNRVALEPGMVVSNEPGYYKPGGYGIRIENLVAVTEVEAPDGAEKELCGFETLTLAPIDLSLVEPALLTEEETAWLDAYHARVRETLASLVDEKTAAWLKEATRSVRARETPIAVGC